ncbi:hypothetical protein Tco_0734624 [Tanacetum coccineum]
MISSNRPLMEMTGAEVQEEPHLDVRPTLQRLPFYCTPPAVADAVTLNPTLEDLAAGTPSSKILAKVEASQKRKASTSGAASSHVAKRTRFNRRSSNHIPAESDSLPHAHAQATKTYYKHQDLRIKKAQVHVTKDFCNYYFQDLPLKYQDYQGNDCQGRLLTNFQDDAKYEHISQDTRSQGGKDLKEKDLKTQNQR